MHHGSAGFISGMYDDIQADVVLLGIAGRGTQEYLEKVPLNSARKLSSLFTLITFLFHWTKKIKKLTGVRFKEFLDAAENHRRSFEMNNPKGFYERSHSSASLKLGKTLPIMPRFRATVSLNILSFICSG